MKIQILIDIGLTESGIDNKDELKDNIIDFTRNLLNNGAEQEGIGYTLCEVCYED